MKKLLLTSLLVSIFCLASSANEKNKARGKSSAQSIESSSKKTHITPSIGFSFTNPKALNADLADSADRLGVKSSYKFSGGANFGIKGEYDVISGLALGARLDYFSTSTTYATAQVGTQKANIRSTLTAIPAYLTTSYRYSATDKWTMGPTAGIGIPFSYKFATEITSSDITNLKNGEPTYSDRPLTWFAGGFTQYQITESVAIRADLEYRYLASSEMRLDEKYGDEKAGRLLETKDKENIKVDLSSFTTAIGITLSL